MRKHVVFVCVGNVCRSPMAEAFARKYGSDVVIASSAGIAPAMSTYPLTRSLLLEKNVDLGDHLPRRLVDIDPSKCDVIVNMSGTRLPDLKGVHMENWEVEDPYGRPEEMFRQVRDEIEMRVMRLILRIRTGRFDAKAAGSRQ